VENENNKGMFHSKEGMREKKKKKEKKRRKEIS